MRTQPLFSSRDLHDVLGTNTRRIGEAIESYDANRLLNTSVEDLADYFADLFWIDPLSVDESGITVENKETKVDVSQDPLRGVFDRSRPFYVPGVEFSFELPFQGDPDLFACQPSRYTLDPPMGMVSNGVVRLIHTSVSPDADVLRTVVDRQISSIRQYVGWIAEEVTRHNDALPGVAHQRIELRRERLLRDRGVVTALGFPLKKREDAPQTFAAPNIRRITRPKPPPASSAPYVPEPALPDADYENILNIITRMSTVLERSPHAFQTMGEEHLRDHFLVQLNGQYEGQATGETFNFEGKTDILVRVDGRNIFVGECKFWRGPKGLTETIDQILGYSTWRDTKAAIVLFNRNKDFSAVLEKISGVVEQHPNCKRRLTYAAESAFRYLFRHRDDPNRELTLTVLAFEVPAA